MVYSRLAVVVTSLLLLPPHDAALDIIVTALQTENMTVNMTQNMAERMTVNMTENMTEKMTEKMTENTTRSAGHFRQQPTSSDHAAASVPITVGPLGSTSSESEPSQPGGSSPPPAATPTPSAMDSTSSPVVVTARPSPASSDVAARRLGTTTAGAAVGVTTPDAAPLETGSFDGDDADVDVAGAGGGAATAHVTGNVTSLGDGRPKMAAAAGRPHQWQSATLTVVGCAVVGSTLIVLVGVWLHRVRRKDSRRLLEEDDEEFTVFNVVDHHYSSRKVASRLQTDKYTPLE